MRAFVAIDLDAALRKALGHAQSVLRPLAPKLKFVDPTVIHLTLKFLGEVDERRVPEIAATLDAVAQGFEPFEFTVRGLGTFADRAGRTRVVWAGVEDVDDALARLHSAVEAGLDAIGFAPEGRPFSPHLTLARARAPMRLPALDEFMERAGARSFGTQSVEEIVLYESILSRAGPKYTAVSRHVLRGVPSNRAD